MSTSDLFQRIPTILIFCLTFTFLTGTVIASENSVGRIPFVISDEDKVPVASQEASAIPEQASSNWAGLSSLKFGEREDTSSVGTPGSLAEVYLRRLAEENNEARKKGGGRYLAASVLGVAVGVSMMPYASVAGTGLAGSMILIGGIGVYYLKWPGRVEREIDRLLNITDPVRRERVGQETLASLAHDARRARIVHAICIATFGASLYVMLSTPYVDDPTATVLNLAFLGSTVYSALKILISESPEEMAFQKYLEESKQGQEVRLRLGIDPSGRVQVGLVLSF